MSRNDEKLSEEAVVLHEYMRQYTQCMIRRRSLEIRRKEIRMEFEDPLKAVSYNRFGKGGENEGSAALMLKLDDIDTKIKESMHKAMDILTEVIEIIEYLPDESMSKIILEYRYIDRISWEKICRLVHISRTPAIRYWRKGLHELLQVEEIKRKLDAYRNT